MPIMFVYACAVNLEGLHFYILQVTSTPPPHISLQYVSAPCRL